MIFNRFSPPSIGFEIVGESGTIENPENISLDELDFNTVCIRFAKYEVNSNGILKYASGITSSDAVYISASPCVIVAIGSTVDTNEVMYRLKFLDILGNKKYLWRSTGQLLRRSTVLKLLDFGFHFQQRNASAVIDFFDSFISIFLPNLPQSPGKIRQDEHKAKADVSIWGQEKPVFSNIYRKRRRR